MGFWAEVRNSYFEDSIDPLEGDVLARISIDGWKTQDENESGEVIASVLLSKHGDILVDYRDGVARRDEMAQEAIEEAKAQLKDYYLEMHPTQGKELLVNHVTLVRERLAEGEHWSDHFWVDANKTPSVELFKAVVQEYLRTPDGQKDIEDSCYDFNWGDAIMFVPLALWESHGIYDADGSYLPNEKGLVPNPKSNGFTFVVDQDEVLIPSDVMEIDECLVESEVQLYDYDDAIAYLCETLNEKGESMDLDDLWEPISSSEFVPLFKSTNYFGIYLYHEGENSYFLLNSNTREHKLVLGDSFEFIGQNNLDCMKDEEIQNVANKEFTRYLVDFSYDNVKGLLPVEKLQGIAVLDSALCKANEKEGAFYPKPSLMDLIDDATKRAADNHNSFDRKDKGLNQDR